MLQSLQSLPRRVLVGLVRVYQVVLSPWLQTGCRYEPTCSGYALQALNKHGAAVGTYLAVHRLLRCHPFCSGGHDPVPDQAPRLFRHLVGVAAPSSHPSSHPSDNPVSPP